MRPTDHRTSAGLQQRRDKPHAAGESSGDEGLLARLDARDASAMAEVYDHCAAATYTIAVSILHDRALAEEVVFEAHLQLWRSPRQALRHHDTVEAYLADVSFGAATERRRAVLGQRADPAPRTTDVPRTLRSRGLRGRSASD